MRFNGLSGFTNAVFWRTEFKKATSPWVFNGLYGYTSRRCESLVGLLPKLCVHPETPLADSKKKFVGVHSQRNGREREIRMEPVMNGTNGGRLVRYACPATHRALNPRVYQHPLLAILALRSRKRRLSPQFSDFTPGNEA
jgi:hypothetical protein